MTKSNILDIILANTYEVIPELEGSTIKEEQSLTDLGANSLDRAEIITLTLEKLDLQIPRVEMLGTDTIGELVNLIYEKQNAN